MKSFLTTFILMTSMPALGWNLPESLDEFRRVCRTHRGIQPSTPVSLPAGGSLQFVPLANIQTGQPRFSFDRVLGNLAKIQAQHGRTRPYDHGRAVYDFHDKVATIFYQGQFYLTDGHHHALAAIYAGATTMPVYVEADWSTLSATDFHHRMVSLGYRYPFNADRSIAVLQDLCELTEDAFLHLAQIFMLKVKTQIVAGKRHVVSAKGSKLPILIKVDDDIPFLEFEIADPLHRAGFVFKSGDDDMIKNDIDQLTIILDILKTAAADHPSRRLHQVLLLTRPTRKKDLDLQKLLDDHFSLHLACDSFLN